jgi:hypothetical protein
MEKKKKKKKKTSQTTSPVAAVILLFQISSMFSTGLSQGVAQPGIHRPDGVAFGVQVRGIYTEDSLE